MGWSGFNTTHADAPTPNSPHLHLTLNFWNKHPPEDGWQGKHGRRLFMAYVDALVAEQAAKSPVRHPYYMAKCEHCGHVGSTEFWDEARNHDDADVVCPRCGLISLADETKAESHADTGDGAVAALAARSERDEFEAWAERDNRRLEANMFEDREPGNNHYYEDDTTNHAYVGWCAARSEHANPEGLVAAGEEGDEK